MGREDEIRLIAYGIWEQEGCADDGRDCVHWLMAEAIWEEKEKHKESSAERTRTAPRLAARQRAKAKTVDRLSRKSRS